ncbi:hypothetical protein SBV1_gp18 [Sulfolobales Beppu virus 1]|nr:hypothetical protein SBV1_gp18 [Sulfolobales Beppu virus 1]
MKIYIVFLGNNEYEIRESPKINFVNLMINDDQVVNFCVPKYNTFGVLNYDCDPSYAHYFYDQKLYNLLIDYYKRNAKRKQIRNPK